MPRNGLAWTSTRSAPPPPVRALKTTCPAANRFETESGSRGLQNPRFQGILKFPVIASNCYPSAITKAGSRDGKAANPLQRTDMTKADLIEEVSRVVEMTRKESEV